MKIFNLTFLTPKKCTKEEEAGSNYVVGNQGESR